MKTFVQRRRREKGLTDCDGSSSLYARRHVGLRADLFDGAPLAHVLLYYDRLRHERLDRSLASMCRRRREKTNGAWICSRRAGVPSNFSLEGVRARPAVRESSWG